MRPCTGTAYTGCVITVYECSPTPPHPKRAQACAGARSACTLQAARWWPSRRAYDRTVIISWLPRQNPPRYVPPESLASRCCRPPQRVSRTQLLARSTNVVIGCRPPRTCFSCFAPWFVAQVSRVLRLRHACDKEARSVQGGQRVRHKKGKAWGRRVFFFELEQCPRADERGRSRCVRLRWPSPVYPE